MNRAVIFSGLLSATVAIFLVDGYKGLYPDPRTHTTDVLVQTNALLAQVALASNSTLIPVVNLQPFHPPGTAITVNTLWSLSLVTSVLSALLAMMVQDWLGNSMRNEARPAAETIERYAMKRLHAYTAFERYGVDQLATLTIGLVHLAVIFFLVGLSIHLSPVHSTPAIAVATLSATAALLYIVASALPLFDPKCPYHTPLSCLLSAIVYGSITLTACIILYVVNARAAVQSWMANKRVSIRDLDPRQILAYLKTPISSARILRPLLGGILRRKSSEELDQIVDRAFELPADETLVAGRALAYLSTRTRAHLVKSPDAARYFARCVLSMDQDGVPEFFVNLRNNRSAMAKLAVAFQHVETTLAAEGSIRLLQMLLSADNPADLLTQARSNQDARWRHMAPILETFPAFAQQVGQQCVQALRQRDSTLHAAVASLRWTLIFSLGNIQGYPYRPEHPGFKARNNIRSLLTSLNLVHSLSMCKVSSDDHENLDDLFKDVAIDPRLELGSRNALSLLMVVNDCGWGPGAWQKPDEAYTPKGAPGMWDWCRLFGLKGPVKEHAPSDCLRDLMEKTRFKTHMPSVTDFAGLGPAEFDKIVADRLLDLSTIVDLKASAAAEAGEECEGCRHHHLLAKRPLQIHSCALSSTSSFSTDTESSDSGRDDSKPLIGPASLSAALSDKRRPAGPAERRRSFGPPAM
ncbi:unnamed protein product [Peniophora sp. CBMAI 1063]|nr:unnamed protein product [Peniophora sp. CBMAI 1063]